MLHMHNSFTVTSEKQFVQEGMNSLPEQKSFNVYIIKGKIAVYHITLLGSATIHVNYSIRQERQSFTPINTNLMQLNNHTTNVNGTAEVRELDDIIINIVIIFYDICIFIQSLVLQYDAAHIL